MKFKKIEGVDLKNNALYTRYLVFEKLVTSVREFSDTENFSIEDLTFGFLIGQADCWTSMGENKYKSFFWKRKELLRIHFKDWKEKYPKEVEKIEVRVE